MRASRNNPDNDISVICNILGLRLLNVHNLLLKKKIPNILVIVLHQVHKTSFLILVTILKLVNYL